MAGGVVQIGIDGSDQFAELRGPAGSLVRGAHEAGVVMDGFGDGHLGAVARVVEAELPSENRPGRSGEQWTKGAMTQLAPGPVTRRATGTLARSPMLSRMRGLNLASAEASASQSAGSAMSSNRSMGGWIERMMRTVRGHVTRRTGTCHQAPRSASR
jgi:hypothetical protein